jgi:hypothetical protein
MAVHVDESGGENLPAGINHAVGWLRCKRLGDGLFVSPATRRSARRAGVPVPSMSWAFLISRPLA